MIAKGSDQAGVKIGILNDDNTAPDLTTFVRIEVRLKDVFNNEKAKYLIPYNNEAGYHPLALSDGNTTLLFNIFSFDSINFRRGKLLADIYFTQNGLSGYPSGCVTEIKDLYLEEVA
jgi:hypothetical protein